MKQLYISAWILLAIAVLATLLSGAFGTAAMLAFGLVALGLVHALALWSAFANTRDLQPE